MSTGELRTWKNEKGDEIIVTLGLVNTKQVQIRYRDKHGWPAGQWVSPKTLSRMPGDGVRGPDEPISTLAIGTE